MGLSVWHVVVVLVVVLILFGAGKLPRVMGDVAKGIKNFKAGLADDGEKPQDTAATRQSSAAVSDQSTAAMPDPANSAGARPIDKTASGGKS
jgi:sec-independent protein translocase protein TatA